MFLKGDALLGIPLFLLKYSIFSKNILLYRKLFVSLHQNK